MANVKLNTRLIIRNDVESAWQSANPRLMKGEFAVSTDTAGGPKIKIGDGTKTWSELSYINATPAELAEYGVKSVSIKGSGNGIANASLSGGVLTLTKGTFLTEHQDISGKLDKNPNVPPVSTESFVKVKYDAKGLITGSTSVVKDDITRLGIPAQDTNTTYTLSGETNTTAGANVVLTPSEGGAQKLNVVGGGTTSVAYADGKITITSTDTSKSYNLKTGETNGTVAFGITGSEQEVAVAGLGSAAYTESTAYDAAGAGETAAGAVQGDTSSTVKDVEDLANSAKTSADNSIKNLTIAGKALDKDTGILTADEIKTAIGVQSVITGSGDTSLPTSSAVVTKVTEMIGGLGSVFNYKGKDTYDNIIAKADAKVGDVWIANDLSHGNKEYVCIVASTPGASSWEELGSTVSLDGYLTEEAADKKYATQSALTSGLQGKQDTINAENKLSGSFINGAVAEATKATQDGDGNVITTTYAKKTELPTAASLGAVTSATGQNGVTASVSGTALTVGLNLTDVFVLNGGNAAGTYV